MESGQDFIIVLLFTKFEKKTFLKISIFILKRQYIYKIFFFNYIIILNFLRKFLNIAFNFNYLLHR